MIFDSFQKITALAMMIVLVGLSVGCSENNGKVAKTVESVADVTQLSKEEIVKRRAQEHMDALIAMDWEKAYSYLSPARRKILPYKVYVHRMNISAILRKSAKVKQVSCEEAACDVEIDLTFLYIGGVISGMQGEQRTSTVHEKWVFSELNWWFVQL